MQLFYPIGERAGISFQIWLANAVARECNNFTDCGCYGVRISLHKAATQSR